MIVAAIWYQCDQNQPSKPLLLKLNVAEGLATALKEVYAAERNKQDDGTVYSVADVVIVREDHYGDLRVMLTDDDNFYLFVTLPDEHNHLKNNWYQGNPVDYPRR
jgi:hypothetical protein